MKKLFGFTILLFFLAGCASSQFKSTPTSSPLLSIVTLTSSPTSTVTPSVTPSPTPTHLKLPVLNGTPVPLSNIAISTDNADQVAELARYWGNPDTVLRRTSDDKTLVVANVEGIYVYDIPSGTLINAFDVHMYFNHYDDWQPLATKGRNFMDISADAKRIAFLTDDESIRVIDSDGSDVFNVHLEAKYSDLFSYSNLAISPDGKLLAVANRQKLLLYEVESGRSIPLDEAPELVCFTGDSQFMVLGPKSIYSLPDFRKSASVNTKSGSVLSFYCDFSPSSSRVAFLFDKAVEIWDVATEESISAFPVPGILYPGSFDAPGTGIRFTVDDRFLITANNYQAKYSLITVAGLTDIYGDLVDAIYANIHCNDIQANCPFVTVSSPDGMLMTSDYKLAPITVGVDPFSLPWLGMFGGGNHNRDPLIFTFLGPGTSQHVIVGSNDSDFVCEVGINGNISCPYYLYHRAYQHLLADKAFYSNKSCEEILFEGLHGDGNKIVSLEYIPGCSTGVEFIGYSSQYNVVMYLIHYEYGSNGNRIFLYDINNSKFIDARKYPLGSATYGIISPNGRYAAIVLAFQGKHDQVMIYDLSTKELIINKILLNNKENRESPFIFSSDDKVFAKVSQDNPAAIDIFFPEVPADILHFDLPPLNYGYCGSYPDVIGLAISPDNSLLALGGCRGEILFVNASNGMIVGRIQAHTGPILRLAFNEDGSLLASLERSGIVKIWGIAP